jgi:hypothetical protein
MSRPAERVVAFYNKRGTCEQWIKEGKGAIKWTRLSCRTFAANAVRLQLHALAYNLGNFLRTLATPEPIKDWSLTSLKDRRDWRSHRRATYTDDPRSHRVALRGPPTVAAQMRPEFGWSLRRDRRVASNQSSEAPLHWRKVGDVANRQASNATIFVEIIALPRGLEPLFSP